MAKIKITSAQYDRLVLNEQETRLNHTQIALNEGAKEVMFGIATLMGINLSGLNKIVGDKALKNTKTMSIIKTTLEDESKVDSLAKALGEKGIEDAENSLAKNAMKIVNKFNSLSDDKLDGRAIKNLVGLDSSVSKEYNLD